MRHGWEDDHIASDPWGPDLLGRLRLLEGVGEVGFRDRADAGRQLAKALGHLQGGDVVVLGVARGGVPVAFEVARALGAPLDTVVVRKVGVPWQPELAVGAVGEDGVGVVNPDVVRAAGGRAR